MEKQWINNLRKRFADRKVAAPDGLWDCIDAAMTGRNVSVEKTEGESSGAKIMAMWVKRAVAVVACVAVMAGLWRFAGTHPSDLAVGSDGKPDGGNVLVRKEHNIADVAKEGDACGGSASLWRVVKSHLPVNAVNAKKNMTDTPDVQEHEALVADNGGDVVKESGKKEYDVNKDTVVKRDKRRSGLYRDGNNDRLMAHNSTANNEGSVSVGLYGANFMPVGGTSDGGGASFMPINMINDPALGEEVLLMSAPLRDEGAEGDGGDGGNEVRVKHRQPIRVGMSVRFKLTGRLALESGMSYSYLSTDIASGDDKTGYKTEQKLHYVGVPLNVNYNIWQNDYFDVYVSAGGTAEFCVSGKSSTEYVSGNSVIRRTGTDVRDKRPQWSANVSAGAQYNFNNLMGVYVEPGVSYYFNNGSNVSTIYKDKPFNFNLNVGLRFTIR